jgi:D-alanyl-lipoteichoic acid acyltransferase DltB (MBOAT superfamily)
MDWLNDILPIERLTDIFSTEIGFGNKLVFTEFNFWIFFILVLVIFSFLHKNKLARSVFLTIVSLYVYFKTSGLFLLVLLISIIVNYFFGRSIYAARSQLRSKWIIAFSAIFNLLILGYFKYAIFFTESFNELFHTDYEVINHFIQYGKAWAGEELFAKPSPSLVSQIILPVGVSFFTFQNISYTVDIYRKEITPVKNFFHYTFFVSFFPQLVMGPIVRARDFIPQISKPYVLKRDDFSWSVIQIVKGLVKKIVIADFLVVHFINRIAEDPSAYPGFVSVLAMWAYSLHIYADFSGYTDIAIGLSRLMGFELKENFNSPYKAINVADFWRRWHKSLGSWLRDYLYIPLGGNRGGTIGSYIAIFFIFTFLIFITGWYDLLYVYGGLTVLYVIGMFVFKDFKRYVHRDLNLLITMVIGGLWHGASENFVIWGAMNGCALIIYKYWKQISPYENKSNFFVHFWKIFITFNFITFTRIWFKLEADGLPNIMLDQIWNHFNFSWYTFVKVLSTYQAVFWIMLGGFIIHWLPEKIKKMYEGWFTRMSLPFQVVSVTVILFLMYQAISSEAPPFVYLMF